ncbi:MAG TPA: 3'-5' exonuclease [Kofleriaceae bacterium]|nr:3'-5' exonuclease [Kofleriaceae bacterium]
MLIDGVAARDREVAKAIASKRQERADFVTDQANTVIELSEDCEDVAGLIALIERVFADDGKPRVVCSSIHKAKGLDADRVWLLADTLDRVKPKDEVQEIEEQNLRYVAITRARKELVYVSGGAR